MGTAPAYPRRTEDQLAEAPAFQRLSQGLHRAIVPILFHHEQLDPRLIAAPDDRIRILKAERHRLLHHDVLAITHEIQHMLGVRSTGREDADDVHCLGRHHPVVILVAGDSILVAECPGTRLVEVAHRRELRVLDALQRFGVFPRDLATAEQCEANHGQRWTPAATQGISFGKPGSDCKLADVRRDTPGTGDRAVNLAGSFHEGNYQHVVASTQ